VGHPVLLEQGVDAARCDNTAAGRDGGYGQVSLTRLTAMSALIARSRAAHAPRARAIAAPSRVAASAAGWSLTTRASKAGGDQAA